MSTRALRRVVSLLLAPAAVLLAGVLAAPAASAETGVGERGPSGLSTAEILGVFVGIPLLVYAVVAAIVMATSSKDDPRLRTGQAWWSEPEYFSAVGSAEQPAVEGSASAGALPAGDDAEPGGARARW